VCLPLVCRGSPILTEQESRSQALQNELQIAKSSNSDAESEIKNLKDQVDALQASHRNTMALVESQNARGDQVSEELTKQHQKNVQLNKELTTLQQNVQAAQSAASSAKYKADNLRQQLDQMSRHNEDLQTQLNNKADENLKLRREKGSRITELQRQNEDARVEIDNLKRSETRLRDQVQTWQSKADEALAKVQQQQEAFARTEESYKRELENQKRLVEMTEQLTKKHQGRVHEMEVDKQRMKDNYENELRKVRMELEKERQTVSDMEGRIQQLEGEVDELQVRLQQEPTSTPQTPRANGSILGRAMSPFTPGSARSRTAITATQALDELYKVKGQLAGEKRRNQQLTEELDQVLTTLEAKAPHINELQEENESLRAELDQLSRFSEQNHDERDQAKKAAKKAEAALAQAQTETKIMRMQLRDLSTQIQMLVFNMHAREKGFDDLTEEDRYRFNQLAKGEITEDGLADMSDTHQFITQKFVVYKDMQELQEKNQELLRVTRELAEQMESDEALAAKHKAVETQQEKERLEQELGNMIDEAKSLATTMESYKKERDMFRRLLQQRATAGELNSILGSDFDETQRQPLASIETGDDEASSAALRQLEATFDNFRAEQDMVRRTLREQMDKVSNEKNTLQSEVAKISSQLTLSSERYEMLNTNFVSLQSEHAELQKRNQTLSETTAKQDMRVQQVTEELVQARELLESTRNETANLRAEKTLWKDIQDRMSKDNEHLVEEKDRLNSLLANQQSIMNERDIAESEARRKTQAKIDTLEAELSDIRRKLSNEMEEGKKLQLRKEYEVREAQKRIDDLSANLSQVREELVGIRSTRDHLEAQVAELTANLKNAQDKVGRLQPLATPRPGLENGTVDHDDEEVAALTEQVAELKREVDLTKAHLENAQSQVERYRNLSNANEEALAELTASVSQIETEHQELVSRKDDKIRELEGRVADLSSELANTNTQLSALQDSQMTVQRRFEDEKNILDEELKRLRGAGERYSESAKFHQQDLRAQADIAAKAQQDYEQELVRHAEAAKHLQALRAEHSELKSQVASYRAAADSAKATLAQSEESWDDRRKLLEKEISEIKARREDTNAQNKLLHQQLENLSAQIAALQQNRLQSDDTAATAAPGVDVEGQRELNSYLRKEKEILEVQHAMKLEECNRLQQMYENSQRDLDDARLRLDQERRARAENSRSSLSHQDLMGKLNELNVYRESSATLRSDLQRAQTQIIEKTAKIEDLEGKVRPLEGRIETLQTEKSFLEVELKQIQEDRNRWQKRTEDILTRYGKVDAAELEQLKQTISTLEAERDSLKTAEEPLKAKITELETAVQTEIAAKAGQKERLTVQFKERVAKDKALRLEIQQNRDELHIELNTAREQLATMTGELEGASRQRAELEKQISDLKRHVQTLQNEATQPKQQADAAAPPASMTETAAPTASAELEQRIAKLQEELSAANAQKAKVDAELGHLKSQLQSATSERDQARERLKGLEAATPTTAGQGMSSLSDADRRMLEEKAQAAEAKAAELEQKIQAAEEEAQARIEATIKQRSDKMKDILNTRLRSAKEEAAAEVEKIKKEKEELELKLEQERVIKAAEVPTPATPAAAMPATPIALQHGDTPTTPTTNTPADFPQMGDAELRRLLTTHPTARQIFTTNLKKKLEQETGKVHSECEAKVAQARNEGAMMEQKKASLKLNITENRAKQAQAKIDVVQKAATETPERPVGEVWEEAKVARPAPAPPRTSNAATLSVAAPSSPAASPQVGSPGKLTDRSFLKTVEANSSTAPSGPATEDPKAGQRPGSGIPKPASSMPAPAATAPSSLPAIPPQGQATHNPFAPMSQPQQEPANIPNNPFSNVQPQSQLPKPSMPPHGQQGQQGQQPRGPSGIPGPRGGHAGRGGRGGGAAGNGPYVPPSNRSASGNAERGGHNQRGRGGHQRGGMNPSANDFQPGMKRPRGDSEVGGGSKRARGGAH